MIVCFVHSKSFCTQSYIENYHDNIDDASMSRLYGNWYNSCVEEIINERFFICVNYDAK